MSYPKPLSEKSLIRRYNDAGITENQVSFLKKFFAASANLYGAITAEEAWNVYSELSSKTETVPLRKREMYDALGILRRETVPFFVFEVDEVYIGAERTDDDRLIVLRSLVSSGREKYIQIHRLLDFSEGKPFFIPANFLEYAAQQHVEQQEKPSLATICWESAYPLAN